MKYMLFFLLFFSLIFCSWRIFGRPSLLPSEKIGFAAAHAIEKKYQITIVGEGGGDKNGKRERITFIFNKLTTPMTVDQVRPIIVAATEDFLNEMNAHPEIAKEFVQFPLTLDNVGIVIGFLDLQGQHVYDPFVSSTGHCGDTFYYSREVYIPPQPGVYGKKYNDFEESFAEAKAILSGKVDSSAKMSDENRHEISQRQP